MLKATLVIFRPDCILFTCPAAKIFVVPELTRIFLVRRPSQHIRYLLDAISQFPQTNPSQPTSDASEELDIPKLLRQIRSRYKVLCSSLGVRPRLVSAESLDGQGQADDIQMDDASNAQDGSLLQSRSQRVAPGSSIPVWKIDNAGMRKPVTNQDLNF